MVDGRGRELTSIFDLSRFAGEMAYSAGHVVTTDGRLVALGASSDTEPLIWIKTWDHRLQVSTDEARTFREIPAR